MTNAITLEEKRELVINLSIEIFNRIYSNGVKVNTKGFFPKHYSTQKTGNHGDPVYVLIINDNQIDEAIEELEASHITYSESLIQSVKNHTALNIFAA
jgi:hypothetical protein